MSAPTVAVVIPTHRKDDAILRALQSVATQTATPNEILVVDDSADGGLVLEPKWDCKVVRSTARRASGARNRGIEASQSDFVAFLDDDDQWHPNHLEHFAELLNQQTHRDRILYSAVANVYDAHSGRLLTRSEPDRLVGQPAIEIAKGNRIATSGVIVSRQLLMTHQFDLSLPRLQDRDLWVRLVASGASLIAGNSPTVDYYFEPKRISFGRFWKANRDMATKLRTLGYSRSDIFKCGAYNFAAQARTILFSAARASAPAKFKR